MTEEEFYNTVIPMRADMIRYANRLAANADDAEDLTQETMLRLWDMHQHLEAGSNLMALASTMLRNRFYDNCRHDSHSCRLSAADDTGKEDLRVEVCDQISLIRHIVDMLPPLQQRLFRMKEIEGYTTEEIMQITGCTAVNLRKNLSRARTTVRNQFIRITQQGGNIK